MLEPDDIHSRNDEFHLDLFALNGNVERTLTMNMRTELPVFGLLGKSRQRDENGHGSQTRI